MKNSIVVSAPGKLMLFGEHSVVYRKPCIVTAVEQRMRVRVIRTVGSEIELIAPEVGLKNFKTKITTPIKKLPKSAKFVFAAIQNFYKKYKISSGLKIETHSDFSSKFGFGSSSAVTVCVVKALGEIFDVQVTNKELFDIAYKAVLAVQGVGSGFDIASAIWGGTLYFVGGGKVIRPINTKGLSLVIGYTGIKADTATLVRNVAELYKTERAQIGNIFSSITGIVEDAKKALLKSDFQKLGTLANINQGFLDALGVNTRELSNLIFVARKAGAYGAKLSGAGGGDCMIAFAPVNERNKIRTAIQKNGGKDLPVKTGAEGVRIEK